MYVCMFIHVFMFCVSLREHNQKYVPPLIHAWHPCDTWMSHVTQSLSHKNGSCHTSMVPHECVMAHSWNVTHEWVMSRSHCRTRISHVTHPWSLMNVSWNTVGTSHMNESCHAVNVALKWVMSHINGPIWMSHDTQPGRQKMNESWYLSIFRGRSFTPILAVAGSWMYVCERAAICVYVSLLNVCVCVCMCHLWVCVCVCVSPMIVCVCVYVSPMRVCVCVYTCHRWVCVCICVTYESKTSTHQTDMGWLRLVGSLKLSVSFAKEPYERDDILQMRTIIWKSLLIEATPYTVTLYE